MKWCILVLVTTYSSAMSEYWLISAPGEKTCQQTWETVNNLTSKQNSLSDNYKFHIPDLKVWYKNMLNRFLYITLFLLKLIFFQFIRYINLKAVSILKSNKKTCFEFSLLLHKEILSIKNVKSILLYHSLSK